MLDDFKFEQKISYKIAINSVKSSTLSHAYIIESNGYHKAFNFALAFAKYIFCPNSYSNNDMCNSCLQCKNIDNNEFLELKIINPTGMWIKKSELDELQEIFSKKSVIGNKKVYIINNAEKLNPSSANSILKFLEEPEEGIIAILIVENINQLLSTIVSRCQILKLVPNIIEEDVSSLEKISQSIFNNNEEINEFMGSEEKTKIVNVVLEYAKYYEDNHFKTIIYQNKIWHQYIKEKNDLYNAFTILLLFYKDVLNYLMGEKIKIFNNYDEYIKHVGNKNKKNILISKINVIINLREKIKYNVNNNLLMDKLVIELEGCENSE